MNTSEEEKTHVEKLWKLCRICGCRIKFSRGYVNAKTVHDYNILLKENYGILPNEESINLKTFVVIEFM